MPNIRVLAIPTALADAVRTTHKSPRYGHPTDIAMATGYGPCRHCLQTFQKGEEQRTLFTYDPFDGIASLPLPGPIFIHTEPCARYAEAAGYPEHLRKYASVLQAFGTQRRLLAEVLVDDASQPEAIGTLLKLPDVLYIHVRDMNAGCYDFRVEPAGRE